MATVRRPAATTFAEAFERGFERGVPAALRLIEAGANVDDADLAEALAHLVHSDHPRAARLLDRLLDAGVSVDALNRFGHTALSVAAGYGRHATVDRLLKLGADPNRGKPSAVQTAIHERDLRMMRMLARAGASSSTAPLWARLFLDAALGDPRDVALELTDHIDPLALFLDRFDDGAFNAVASMTRLRALAVFPYMTQSLATAIPETMASHPSLEVILLFDGRLDTAPASSVLTTMPSLKAVHIAQLREPTDRTVDVPGVEITYGA